MPTNQLAPPDMPWLTGGPPLRPNGLGPPLLNYAAPPSDTTQGAGAAAAGQQAWQWLQDQRAESVRQGLLDPDTGLPTQKGVVEGARATAEGVMMGTTAPGEVPPPGIVAYHGSPHSFDQFDTSKIGTGEGAQAYGHGLYFAGAEQTAKTYRDALSSPLVSPEGEMVRPPAYSVDDIAKQLLVESKGDWDAAIGRANADVAASRKIGDGEWLSKFGGMPDRLREMQEQGYTYDTTPGSMYQVNIGADPEHFLDWDKPLSEQSQHVQDALGKVPWTEPYLQSGNFPGSQIAPKTPEGAQQLKDAGIPGIRYLDQGSRGAGQGTHNYVVFDPATIDILRKYGIAGLIAGGGAAAAGTQQQPPSQNEFRPQSFVYRTQQPARSSIDQSVDWRGG